jgi:uncharacterized membrane protein
MLPRGEAMEALLAAVVVVGTGLAAGVLFSVALSVVPAFRALTPERYIQLHRLIGRRYDRVMPPIVLTCTVLDVALAVNAAGTPARVAFAVAAGCGCGVAALSQLGNVPINRRVKRMPDAPVPDGWTDPRARWRTFNLARTWLAVLSLAANAAALALLR